ncbi:MAG: glutathione S-transferase [Sneathiella sp.]|nr:MAG: glutathione S-transferase [Sneathiella sp.]
MTLKLHNFHRSAYGRIAEITLREKRLDFERQEINPFAEDISEDYLRLHPFKRVPVLEHDDLVLYETRAITEYLEDRFGGPKLRPDDPVTAAKMRQIIAIIDNYGYWPLVRMVFSQRISRPASGLVADETIIAEGLAKSALVLAALEAIIGLDEYLVGPTYSLADAHVVPMIDYFCWTTEGTDMLANYPKLNSWWQRLKERPSTLETRPDWPTN